MFSTPTSVTYSREGALHTIARAFSRRARRPVQLRLFRNLQEFHRGRAVRDRRRALSPRIESCPVSSTARTMLLTRLLARPVAQPRLDSAEDVASVRLGGCVRKRRTQVPVSQRSGARACINTLLRRARPLASVRACKIHRNAELSPRSRPAANRDTSRPSCPRPRGRTAARGADPSRSAVRPASCRSGT